MADEVVATGDSAAAASGSTASPTVTPDTTASAAPATQATASSPDTSTTGEPPKERWADILANTRTKTRDETLAEWRQQYGWAESVKQDQLREMSDWYHRYQGDPGDFLERAYQEALQHPVHGATVKSRIGKMLASMKAAEPQADIEPDIPVMNDQGQIVNRTYSADAVKKIVQQAVQEALGKEVAPLQQDFKTRQQQAEQQRQQTYITKESARVKARIEKYPKASENWPAIQKASQTILASDPEISVGEAVSDAYMQVVYPTLSAAAQAQVLSDNQKKAMAQTVAPGMSSGQAKPKFKNHLEALKYYDAHPEEAAALANR